VHSLVCWVHSLICWVHSLVCRVHSLICWVHSLIGCTRYMQCMSCTMRHKHQGMQHMGKVNAPDSACSSGHDFCMLQKAPGGLRNLSVCVRTRRPTMCMLMAAHIHVQKPPGCAHTCTHMHAVYIHSWIHTYALKQTHTRAHTCVASKACARSRRSCTKRCACCAWLAAAACTSALRELTRAICTCTHTHECALTGNARNRGRRAHFNEALLCPGRLFEGRTTHTLQTNGCRARAHAAVQKTAAQPCTAHGANRPLWHTLPPGQRIGAGARTCCTLGPSQVPAHECKEGRPRRKACARIGIQCTPIPLSLHSACKPLKHQPQWTRNAEARPNTPLPAWWTCTTCQGLEPPMRHTHWLLLQAWASNTKALAPTCCMSCALRTRSSPWRAATWAWGPACMQAKGSAARDW